MASRTIVFKRVVIKTLICALTALILAILAPHVALANGRFTQLVDTDQMTNLTQYTQQTFGEPTEEFTLGSSGGYVNLKFKIFIDSATEDPVFVQYYLQKDAEGYINYFTNCGSLEDEFDGFYLPLDTCQNVDSPYDFLKDYVFETGHTYNFFLQLSGGTGKWYGSTENVYPNGACAYCSPLADLYFDFSIAAQNSIQIVFPEDTSSIADFSFWKVSGYTLSAGTSIEILSKDSESTVWVVAGGRYLEEAGAFDNWLILKNIVYHIDTFQAYAELRYENNFASSTLISFDITALNPEIIPFYPTPTSTATSSEWVIACDPESGLFERSICYLFQYLFVPKYQDFAKFYELRATLELKPPLGYFVLIKNTLTNLGATSTPAFILENATSTLAAPIYNPLKNGITFILWFLFIFWIFNRIRHFDLT